MSKVIDLSAISLGSVISLMKSMLNSLGALLISIIKGVCLLIICWLIAWQLVQMLHLTKIFSFIKISDMTILQMMLAPIIYYTIK